MAVVSHDAKLDLAGQTTMIWAQQCISNALLSIHIVCYVYTCISSNQRPEGACNSYYTWITWLHTRFLIGMLQAQCGFFRRQLNLTGHLTRYCPAVLFNPFPCSQNKARAVYVLTMHCHHGEISTFDLWLSLWSR